LTKDARLRRGILKRGNRGSWQTREGPRTLHGKLGLDPGPVGDEVPENDCKIRLLHNSRLHLTAEYPRPTDFAGMPNRNSSELPGGYTFLRSGMSMSYHRPTMLHTLPIERPAKSHRAHSSPSKDRFARRRFSVRPPGSLFPWTGYPSKPQLAALTYQYGPATVCVDGFLASKVRLDYADRGVPPAREDRVGRSSGELKDRASFRSCSSNSHFPHVHSARRQRFTSISIWGHGGAT